MAKRVSGTLFVVLAFVAVFVGAANWRLPKQSRNPLTFAPGIGTPGAPRTTREDLARTIEKQTARLAEQPDDARAAILLADALMRQVRVTGNGSLTLEAEQALKRALRAKPGDYEAQRMLGAVYLSQHRFRDAIAAAGHAHQMRPADPWNYGVIGDGHLELGEYDEAFEAFQKMVDMRPNAASYARAAYARELQGDLDGALKLMEMATDATSPHDPESIAWHRAQAGDLYFQLGRLEEAKRAYAEASLAFPRHPFALAGMAKLKVAAGDLEGALALCVDQLREMPTLDLAAQAGDLSRRLGRHDKAERYYVMAEQIGREASVKSEAALARFLSERDRKVDEAVRLAEDVARHRDDIFTDDALAWTYFKAGRLADAAAASRRTLRTGSRDRRLLYHAAAIQRALGHTAQARRLARRALGGPLTFDLIAAPDAEAWLK